MILVGLMGRARQRRASLSLVYVSVQGELDRRKLDYSVVGVCAHGYIIEATFMLFYVNLCIIFTVIC